jgi:hypothetical protein
VSIELEKAKAQIAAAQYKQAVSTLWEAERWAQGDLTEARGLLEVATALRDKADGRLKADCDYFIKWAERCIQKESARPLVALAANAMAVVGGCNVLGGHGLPPQVGQSWNLIFSQGRLHLVRGLVIADVPYAEIVALEIGGPAAQRRGGGFFAGGFGVTGAAEGMLVAAALNLLTTTATTTVSTVVCLMTSSAELFLHTSSETPDDLRMRLSPVFTVLRQQETAQATSQSNGGGSPVERLAKLASLLEKDLISRAEFDRLKADLLKSF